MAIGIGIGLSLSFGGGGGSAPVAGASATTFATTPAIHYHPNSQSGGGGYTKSGDQVTACPSLGSLAAAMSGLQGTSGAVVGPLEMTDALGRKFWRFNGSQAALIDQTLTAVANRGITTVMVARVHHHANTQELFRPRWSAYTNDTTNTAANASIFYMRAVVTANSAPFLQGQAPIPTTVDAANAHKFVPGAQLQVMGVASRTDATIGAGLGQRIYMNGQAMSGGQMTTSVTGYVGGVIGGSAGSGNQANVTLAANTIFDLYEFACWTGEVSTVNADANQAAAVANFAISDVDQQLVLEGDSITFGIATGLSVSPANGGGVGSVLSAPGAGYLPATCRLINLASSGALIATAVTRRDGTNSIFSAAGVIPGGTSKNKIALHMGRNDAIVSGPASTGVPATMYSSIVALWNTVTTGYLQRGWSGVQVGNIASSATAITGSPPDDPTTLQARIEALRALMFTGTAMNSTFKTDTLTNTGQTYEGLLSVIPVHEITVSGNSAFLTSTDAADTAAGYYDTDATHLRVAGAELMASGGDNAPYGYGAAA